MVGVPQRDNFRGPRVAARGENGGLVGFGAAGGEKRFGQFLHRCDLGELFCQRRLRFIGEHGGDVLQAVDLRVQLAIHFFIAMPDADGYDAAEKVQVLIPVGIPDVLILGV